MFAFAWLRQKWKAPYTGAFLRNLFTQATTLLHSLRNEQCPNRGRFCTWTIRNKDRFPLSRWGLWSPLQDIVCPLIITWQSHCRKILRTAAEKNPLPLKEKAFLGFQCSLLYLKRTGHLGFLRLHDNDLEGCSWQGTEWIIWSTEVGEWRRWFS